MKYCDKCKVVIEDGVHHCPLCGRSVDSTPDAVKITRFPDYAKFYKHRLHVTSVLGRILIILALICVGLNFILPFTSFWSAYVLACVFWAIIGVLMPVRYKMPLSAQVKFQIFGLSAIIIAVELVTQSFGWGVGYVIPSILMGYSIVCMIMLIVNGHVDFEYLLPIAFITFCSALLFILNKFVFNVVAWPSLIPLVFSVLTIAILFVLRFKRTIKCIKKYWKF